MLDNKGSERLTKLAEIITNIMKSQYPDIEWMMVGIPHNDKEEPVMFIGNGCPVCLTADIVELIEENNIQHMPTGRDEKRVH